MRRVAQSKTGPRWWLGLGLALLTGGPPNSAGQTSSLAVTPSADAFVRSLASGNNYGSAGALSVSGAAAANGQGQQNGLFDSLLRFPLSDPVNSFNRAFGSNHWVVVGVTLALTEVAAPNNAIFNRGMGAFEVRWIANDTWVEGTGTPNAPTADGAAYQDLPSLLNPVSDVSLGQFTNSGLSGVVSFPLPLPGPLVSTITTGGDLNLYLKAASASVGFTFNSRNFGTPSAWPSLTVAALARPEATISAIEPLGANQVAIHFLTSSNWTYTLQRAIGVSSGTWTNLSTIPAKPLAGEATLEDTRTKPQSYYRLLLAP